MTEFQTLNSIIILRQVIDSCKEQIKYLEKQIEKYENTIKGIKKDFKL